MVPLAFVGNALDAHYMGRGYPINLYKHQKCIFRKAAMLRKITAANWNTHAGHIIISTFAVD